MERPWEVCDRKRLYDTEFEAERTASIMEKKYGDEFMWYKCGKHWHIAHTEQVKRNKHNRLMKAFCDVCEVNMRPEQYATHITKRRHIRKLRGMHDVNTRS